LNEPRFRCQYNQIMLDLVDGPLSAAAISAALDEFQAALSPWLASDPTTEDGEVGGLFDGLRNWAVEREASVRAQLEADMPLFNRHGDLNCDGAVGRGDATLLARRFGIAENGRYGAGDLNRDGIVDVRDLAILQGLFSDSIVSATASPVPEPGALALLATAPVILRSRFRRRHSSRSC
jgi:hypothetical protein